MPPALTEREKMPPALTELIIAARAVDRDKCASLLKRYNKNNRDYVNERGGLNKITPLM